MLWLQGDLVDLSFTVFLVSGGLLTFERLSVRRGIGTAYVIVPGYEALTLASASIAGPFRSAAGRLGRMSRAVLGGGWVSWWYCWRAI